MKKKIVKTVALFLCFSFIFQILPLQLSGDVFTGRLFSSPRVYAGYDYLTGTTTYDGPRMEYNYLTGTSDRVIIKTAKVPASGRSDDSGTTTKQASLNITVIKHAGSVPKYIAQAKPFFQTVLSSGKLGPIIQLGTNYMQTFTNFGTGMSIISLPLQAINYIQQIRDYNSGKIDYVQFSLSSTNMVMATGYGAWLANGAITGAGVFAAGTTFPIWATALWIAVGIAAPVYSNWDTIRPIKDKFVGGIATTGERLWSPLKTSKYFAMGVWDWIWGTGEVPNQGATGIPVKKPNIYLYSPLDVAVNVKINPYDSITNSIPLYPHETGWNTYIRNGSINAAYDYLFYEAMVADDEFQTRYGYIMRKDSLKSDMEKLLETYNFNSTEIRDFIEYWSVELSGMGDTVFYPQPREVIDSKISLVISPAPSRVYREWFYITPFTGIIPETPEKVEPFERNGYYGIEWGGLLRK